MCEDLEQIAKLKFGKEMRAFTILGLAGGGGLGQAIHNNVQLGFYSRLGALILLT